MYWSCNNNRYIGSWRDDLKHGKGNYRWSTGNRYNGDYYDDKPHGSGVYSTVHGDNYVGKFTNGLFQGKTIVSKTAAWFWNMCRSRVWNMKTYRLKVKISYFLNWNF